MNPFKLLKLSRLIKEKNIDNEKLFDFLEKLTPQVGLEDATQFVSVSQKNGVISKYTKPEAEMTVSEIEAVKKEIKEEVFQTIHAEIMNLLYVSAYNNYVDVQRGDRQSEERIYGREEAIKNLSPSLRRIVDNYSPVMEIVNSKIHPTIFITLSLTPDTLIDNINVPAQHMSISGVGVEKDFTGVKNGENTFSRIIRVSWEQPAFFLKEVSLLQIFARFGLDDLVEKSIVYGADIDYKDQIHGLTALGFYNPSALSSPELISYTKSLLDGSYKNGVYQVLYEKKKLENAVVEQSSVGALKKQYKI